MKWSVILADRLGPEILTMLEIKAHVLHRVRVHLKVPDWLSDLKALLTRKLSMFLSRLNEICGGREKMCLVSGSLRIILKFLRIKFLTCSQKCNSQKLVLCKLVKPKKSPQMFLS